MNSIVIVATIVAKEGKAEFVKNELKKLLEPTEKESGNISYKIHQDLQDMNKFVAVEEWKDSESIKAHMVTDHIRAYGLATSENDAIESFEHVTLNTI